MEPKTQFVPSLDYVEDPKIKKKRWYFPQEQFGTDSENKMSKQAQDMVNRLGLLIESGTHPDTAIGQLELTVSKTDSYQCPKNGLMEWRVVNSRTQTLIPTAADGLHHRYVERGSGELLYSILSTVTRMLGNQSDSRYAIIRY
eukprot:Em0012g32a